MRDVYVLMCIICNHNIIELYCSLLSSFILLKNLLVAKIFTSVRYILATTRQLFEHAH